MKKILENLLNDPRINVIIMNWLYKIIFTKFTFLRNNSEEEK